MDINNFVEDNKFVIPEKEIDNIYIWTRISKTQEVLLDMEAYYKLLKHSFDTDVARVVQTLGTNFSRLRKASYTFADFITFTANKDKIFNGTTCFVCSTNSKVLDSLTCYIAHTLNRYCPVEETVASLILNKIDEPDRFAQLMASDVLLLNIYTPIPEHKHRNAILDMLLSKRSKANLFTLIFTINISLLINKNLISKEQADKYCLKDISGLSSLFEQRRQQGYKDLMRTWLELSDVNATQLVYSKTKPEQQVRLVGKC